MTKQNFGKLTKKQQHELDCKLYDISDKVYMFDPQPYYQITENKEGETIATFENGFEHYIEPALVIGL